MATAYTEKNKLLDLLLTCDFLIVNYCISFNVLTSINIEIMVIWDVLTQNLEKPAGLIIRL